MITKDYTIFKLSAGQHMGRLTSYFGNDRIKPKIWKFCTDTYHYRNSWYE